MNNSRDAVLMQMLRGQMTGWLDVIRRGTGATRVEFSPRDDGNEFAIVMTWQLKDGTTKTEESHFSRQRVFGDSLRGPVLGWRIQKKACDYARDVLREVLERRGIVR